MAGAATQNIGHLTMIKLDIFSDPVCPWCYLGKANLDRALEQNPNHPFQIEWHPFQLNPDMAPEGVDKHTYLLERFGSQSQLDAIHQRFRDIAKANGVKMDPDTPKRIPNTLNAHRIIHWAGLEGRQTFAVTALMRAYWVEGRDIGTVVLPDSRLKVFLTATPEARAKRRSLEVDPLADNQMIAQTQEELLSRDEKDSGREHSPLKPAVDSRIMDTSELSLEQVVDQLVILAHKTHS